MFSLSRRCSRKMSRRPVWSEFARSFESDSSFKPLRSLPIKYLFEIFLFSTPCDIIFSLSFEFITHNRDFLGWAILLNFLVYVTIPVALRHTGILLSFGSVVIYVGALVGLAEKGNFFWEQVSGFLDFGVRE